jgi:hypothetical protein
MWDESKSRVEVTRLEFFRLPFIQVNLPAPCLNCLTHELQIVERDEAGKAQQLPTRHSAPGGGLQGPYKLQNLPLQVVGK